MFMPGILPIWFWFPEFFSAAVFLFLDDVFRRCIPDIFIPGIFIPGMLLMSCFFAVCFLRVVLFFFRDVPCDLDFAFGLFMPGILDISCWATTGIVATGSMQTKKNVITSELSLNTSMPFIIPPRKFLNPKRTIKRNTSLVGNKSSSCFLRMSRCVSVTKI